MKNIFRHISNSLAILVICLMSFSSSAKSSVDPATILKEFVGQIKLYENFYPVSYTEKKFFEEIKQIQDVSKICNKVQKEIEAEKKQKFIIKDFPEQASFKRNVYSQLI